MRRRRILQAIFWIAVYIALAVAPLLIIIAGPRLPRQSFWQLFSVALGFAGLSMMALQFVLTARFKTIKAPYGSDIVYQCTIASCRSKSSATIIASPLSGWWMPNALHP